MVRRFRQDGRRRHADPADGLLQSRLSARRRAFCQDAAAAGVDGFILVDLPPEEADELKPHAVAAGIDTVLLTAPTTDDKRLPAVLKYSSGFVYFVSVLGITGTKSATEEAVRTHVERIKRHTELPVAVGFGIRDAGPGRGGRAARRRRRRRLGDRRSREGGPRRQRARPSPIWCPASSPTSRRLQTACAACASLVVIAL